MYSTNGGSRGEEKDPYIRYSTMVQYDTTLYPVPLVCCIMILSLVHIGSEVDLLINIVDSYNYLDKLQGLGVGEYSFLMYFSLVQSF